ncbi:MAG: carboxypeptidase regulatory-like domain-containing protein, partial [Longimicrobiales bacterium]
MRPKYRGSSPLVLAATLLTLLPGAAPLWAQATGSITGAVRSASTGQAVPSAEVQVVGTLLVGLTNEEGRYLIPAVPVGQHTLRVNVLGFSRREV